MNLLIVVLVAAAAFELLRRGDMLPELPRELLLPWPSSSPGPDRAWMPSPDPDNPYMPTPEIEAGPEQLPTFLESISVTASEAAAAIPELVGLAAPAPAPDQAARNERAFLDMIAFAEGTAGPDGYRAMFGYPAPGRLAPADLRDHPGIFFDFTDKAGRQLKTSAAGRYQFLLRTWRDLQERLQLPDFGPDSQDRAALELIRQRGALRDVQAGRVPTAVDKVRTIWASLPGAGYAQQERKLPALLASYTQAGGNLET